MNAITLHQPWATLVALGVKTIETRSWPAPKSAIGQRLAIHAGSTYPPPYSSGVVSRMGDYSFTRHARTSPNYITGPDGQAALLPLGAVVASAILTDCVPILAASDGSDHFMTAHPHMGGGVLRYMRRPESDPQRRRTATYIEHQLPYGDFRPGRWAWLLDDIKATTERCPACWGAGEDEELGICDDGMPAPVICMTCRGVGRCEPIPAKGHQRIWRWEPQ